MKQPGDDGRAEALQEIVRDVLDQFESHRQLLGRVYS